jgi:hypothetical protein
MKTVFLRVLEDSDKAAALRRAITEPGASRDAMRFDVNPTEFSVVPRSPFAYWVSDRLRSLYTELPSFASDQREAKHGAATLDDVRFVRLWFETGSGPAAWVPFAKGGSYAPFYADIHLVLNWSNDGSELKANASAVRERNGWGDQWTAVLNGYSYYFRPGLTWPPRSARFSAAALPAGCVFSQSGKAAFAPEAELPVLLGLFNSAAMTILARVQSDAVRIKFEVGLVEQIPLPSFSGADADRLQRLSHRGWSCRRALDTRVETSHSFVLPALLQVQGESLAARAAAWAERIRSIDSELLDIQSDLDKHCFALYGIDQADQSAPGSETAGDSEGSELEDIDDDESGDEDRDFGAERDAAHLANGLVSWAVGAAFGRFDVRLPNGERELSREPESFDPLPVCSPAMLAGEDGLPLAAPPPGYSLLFPTDGVLVDDPGDARDLTAAVRAVFNVVFAASADARWDEAAALLDPRGHDLRAWLRSAFFERHLKLYSKSRRKAPIMWQLGTPSGRYSVWLYAHRLTNDSFFQLQNDVLAPKLAYEERQLTNLVQSSGGSPSAKDRREIEAQERFVEELRVILEEVKRVAPLWRPTLDDGIVLVMAPLWRLVPHKPWQRELKKQWSELAAGKYDWAQLAMHLWPERVVAKCGDDRSLAIAHSLEEVFWIEDEDGKWHPRQEATTGVNDLIRERTSAAVKDALGALA